MMVSGGKKKTKKTKQLYLGHIFFVFSILSTRGKLASFLWMKLVWAIEISKWNRCYSCVSREAVQVWSPGERPLGRCTTGWSGHISWLARGPNGSELGRECVWAFLPVTGTHIGVLNMRRDYIKFLALATAVGLEFCVKTLKLLNQVYLNISKLWHK